MQKKIKAANNIWIEGELHVIIQARGRLQALESITAYVERQSFLWLQRELHEIW